MTRTVLGVIGGSGLYDLPGLDNTGWKHVSSPWGEPSDDLFFATLDGVDLVFLPRHGRGHRIGPSDVNFRANIDALKRAGATDLLSLSACGSLREHLAPGTFVIVDQFIDRTFKRENSFFGPGIVAHVSMARPVCRRLAGLAEAACKAGGIPHVRGGVCLVMEGPQFSARAESELYRAWGCDVINMTAMPEAKLAREAEIPYAAVAMVTDYDCWRDTEDAVEVANVLDVLRANARKAQGVIADVARGLGPERAPAPGGLDTVLDAAIITAPEARDPELAAMLDAVAGRVLKPRAEPEREPEGERQR